MPSQPLVAATFDGFNSQFEMQKDEGGEKEDEEESFNSQFEMLNTRCTSPRGTKATSVSILNSRCNHQGA